MAATLERQSLDGLRAEVQRKLAAQLDVGQVEPETAAPPEPIVFPKPDRRRMETLRADAQKNFTVQHDRRNPGAYRPGLFGKLALKPSRVALLAVALLAGGLAAYLVTQNQQPAVQPATPRVVTTVPVPQSRILVAKQTIAVGQRLTPAALEWRDWPVSAVLPQYITLKASPDAVTDMGDTAARVELFAGEPIRTEKLVKAGGGYLSAILEKGTRGVSVSVAAEGASGGFIVPNDHVDVVLLHTSNSAHDAETILQNVRVLAINGQLGGNDAKANKGSGDPGADVFSGQAIATLELDPIQAEVITSATTMGKLSLVLRPTSDSTETEGAGSRAERATNAAIRLSSPFWAPGNGNASTVSR